MKLPIRSLRVPYSRKRDRLRFFGKTTVLNVHETGITVEGLMPTVWYPLFMRFLYRALSDWTIRTIPFAQIRKCKIVSQKRKRIILSLIWAIFLVYIFSELRSNPVLFFSLIAGFGIPVFLFIRMILRDSVHLEFETKNKRLCAFRIRFPKKGDAQLLFEELKKHRLEVTAPTLAKVAHDATQKRSLSSIFGFKPKGPTT